MQQSPSWKANSSTSTKNFLVFYGSVRLITLPTKACQLSLSWARSTLFTPSQRVPLRFIWILSSNLVLGLQSGLFSSGLFNKTLCVCVCVCLPHTCHIPSPFHSSDTPGNLKYNLSIASMFFSLKLYEVRMRHMPCCIYCSKGNRNICK
jgi:hypothetical protein